MFLLSSGRQPNLEGIPFFRQPISHQTYRTNKWAVLDLFLERGVPVHIRSDNGSEFIAKKVRKFLSRLSVKPLFIEPVSPWENGYIESFNGKMRDELLTGEIFYSLKEA